MEVQKARALEMKKFEDKGVRSKVPREELHRTDGNISRTR